METLRQRYLLAGVLITGGGLKIEEKGFNKSMLQSVVQWALRCPGGGQKIVLQSREKSAEY